MWSNGNSYGTSNATELGPTANDTRPGTAVPRWFLPVVVWQERPGK